MNAGFSDSWVWPVREAVRESTGWHFESLQGPQASWLSESTLAEQRKLLPAVVFARLWLNQWSSGSGDALTDDQLDESTIHVGPMRGDEPGWLFVGGLDLGLRSDHTGLVVLGYHVNSGRIRLAQVQHWKPPKEGALSVGMIEQELLCVHRQYRLALLVADPHQAEYLGQRIRRQGIPVERFGNSSKHQVEMATTLLEVFRRGGIELYPSRRLRSDLLKLFIEEKSYGYRLSACRDAEGHADTATAFCLALPHCTRRALAGSIAYDEPSSLPTPRGPDARHGINLKRGEAILLYKHGSIRR